MNTETIARRIKEQILSFDERLDVREQGRVMSCADGIARVSGLQDVMAGELLYFPHAVRGIAMNLEEDAVGAVLLDDARKVQAGDPVRRSGSVAQVPVGDALLGHVVSALGQPLDGSVLQTEKQRPLEKEAPGIMARQSVSEPLQIGILMIDALVPIGKGQRELIIGDRQSGKSAIALDAIVNQKGKQVKCIYVTIGQKASTSAQLAEQLARHGAMDHTVIVSASAADSALMQYMAPYAGCAIGEEWMERGEDVLIVFDDLSAHAIAYRTISLLLKRPAGREAYPGDIFYLHSRLLERAGRLSDERGGGSMTALPIVETQGNDISAYIPTNVISITDGQIFLQPDLFHAGIRPAVDVGLSVSRVGGAAQSKAMRQAAAGLKLRLAQFHELRAFARFGSDLDEVSRKLIRHGETLTQLLVQQRFAPLTLAEQCVLLQAAKRHMFDETARTKLPSVRERLLAFMHGEHEELMQAIEESGRLDEERMERALDAFTGCDEPE